MCKIFSKHIKDMSVVEQTLSNTSSVTSDLSSDIETVCSFHKENYHAKRFYNECKRKRRILNKRIKLNRSKVLVENLNRITTIQAISNALIDELEEEDPTGLFVPKFGVPELIRQETCGEGYEHFDPYVEAPRCCCADHSALLYCDFINILASPDRDDLNLETFKQNYKVLRELSCDCEARKMIVSLIRQEFSVQLQAKGGLTSWIFGDSEDMSSVVDEKIQRVGVVLNSAASNIRVNLTDDAKNYMDSKFEKLESIATNAKIGLSIPDVTGVGNILSRLFNSENVGVSSVVIFSVLFLTRKYFPSIGDICALFAGMAMCYVSSSVIMPILLSWLNPTPQSAGEWIRVVSEVIGISMFAAKGKWELNLGSILANFAAIEREKPLLEQLLERMQNLVFTIIRLCAEACGHEFVSDFSPIAEKIRHLRKRINSINKDPSRHSSPSVGYVNDVFRLQDDIMEVFENVSVTKGNERYVAQINTLISTIRPLCEYLESNKFENGSRFAPFIRTLVGFSGVGKTAIAERLNRKCFDRYATDDTKLAAGGKYSSICYPVQSGQKYFESYNRQFCTQINDMFQKREKLGDEFSPSEFVVQGAGNSVMLLKVACMTKKDRIAMASLLFDISTNLYCINTVSCPTLQNAVPLNRRLAGYNNSGFPCIMAVHQKYGMEIDLPEGEVYPTPPEGKPKNYFKLTVDFSKAARLPDGSLDIEKIYEFYDWNFTTGQLKKGYRKYSLVEYEDEFLRRFDLHYKNQVSYLRQRARNGVVDLGHLPAGIVVQGKSSFEDLCAISRMKSEKSAELLQSLENDTPTPMYDSESEFDRIAANNPDLFYDGYGIDSDDESEEHVPFYDPAITETVVEGLCKVSEEVPSSDIRDVMQAYVDEPERGLNVSKLDIKQRRAMRGWSIEEMRKIIKCSFTDPMVYALRKAMSYGYLFSKAFSLVAFSLISVLEYKSREFTKDPLAWFKGHPFVSASIAGIASLSIYKLVSMSIKFFRSFGRKEEVWNDPLYNNLAHKQQCERLYAAHLNDPAYEGRHNMGCCSVEAIIATHNRTLASPQAIPMAEVVPQGAIPGDKKWEYANATLENYYTFWVKYTFNNPDGNTFTKMEDEVKSLAIKGHLYNLPYHILRMMICYSRLSNCTLVEFGLTPVLTSSIPAVWYDFRKVKWIIRDNSEARDEVFFQMPSGTKIHGSAVKRMPTKEPEYLKILTVGSFPVKFYRSVGRSTPMNAVLRKGKYSYPLPEGVMGSQASDLLAPAMTDYEGFTIDIETIPGDCGSPCFMWSNSFTHLVSKNKVFQHPFIVYRHLAWQNLLKYGFGAAYFQEDYDWIEPYVLSVVKVKDRVSNIEDNIENMVRIANTVTGQCKTFVPMIVSPEVEAPIAAHHIPIGTIEEVRINRKNNIKRSELFPFIKQNYGVEGKLTKMPTNLNPTDRGDPLVLGIQSYGGNTEVKVDPLDVDVVSDFIVADIINSSSPITDDMRTLIPIEKCITGGDGLRGLNRKSGIGPSLTHMCKNMGIDPGEFKKSFGVEGDYDFDNPNSKIFVEICKDGLEKAKKGEALPVLFQNHLKVECKQGDKVRLFHGADKNSVPVFVSGFGELIKWVVANRIKNGILIGCNPAKDWPHMYAHLTSVGQYGFAADFSKFDKFQIYILLNLVMVLARAFYGNFDPEGNLARECIFECLKNPAFVFAFGSKSCVYSWQHGNCSGNFLTTLINCLAGIFIIYYAILTILRAHSDFRGQDTHTLLCYIRDNVRYEVMGDDNVITMSAKIREYVNWYNYQAAVFDIFHMELTDDQKGRRIDFVIPLHTHILEFSILGRGIKFVDGRVVAPLRDSSLFEALAWYKGKDRNPNSLVLNVERTLAELSARGRKEFSLNARKIADETYKQLGVYPSKHTTFEAAFAAYHSLKFPEYNLYQEDDEDQETSPDPATSDPFYELDLLCERKLLVSKDNLHREKKTTPTVVAPLEVGKALCVVETKNNTPEPTYILQSKSGDTLVDGGLRINDEMLNVVSTDKHETTEFVEGDSKVLSTEMNNVTKSNLEVRGESIKDFLHKPYLLTNFNWTSALAVGANLYTVDIGGLLNSVSIWQKKAEGYELFRGTFNIRVQINADPFMQGRALIHYIPNYLDRVAVDPKFANRYNYHMVQKFQHPHIELDLHDSVAEMSIPYVAPSAWYDRKSGTYDWGRVWIDIISPLEVGAAAGNKNAEVSVFGYWTDVEMAAAIVPQSKSKGFKTSSGELAKQEDTMKISNGLQIVAKAADTLSDIPLLRVVMGPLSWASRTAASLASVFGWSKVYIEDKHTIVSQQTLRYSGCSTGPDVSICSALIHDNKTQVTTDYTITDEDEMSLKRLLSVPTYMGPTTWTTAQASNTLLLSQVIKPQNFKYGGTQAGTGFINSYAMGAPLYYLSNFFGYYRGSINVILKLVKTKFHSGKLLVTFTPITTVAVVPDTSTSVYSLRTIVDIREQSVIKLNLPYLLHRTYCMQSTAIGTLHVRVLNDLRCPETCAQQVQILTYYVAGDDFEYQVPCTSNYVASGIYTPQSKSTGAEVLINTGVGASKVQPCNTMYSSTCIGEHFTSLKQLLNRNTQIQPRVSQTWAAGEYHIYPYFATGYTSVPVTGVLQTEGWVADAFSLFAPMYAYFRGSARIMLYSNASNLVSAIDPLFYKFASTTTFITNTNTTSEFCTNNIVKDYPAPDKNPVNSAIINYDVVRNLVFHQGTYQNMYPVSFVHVWQGDGTDYYTDDTTPGTALTCVTSSGVAFGAQTTLHRSFTDEFQLSFFIACPPLFISQAVVGGVQKEEEEEEVAVLDYEAFKQHQLNNPGWLNITRTRRKNKDGETDLLFDIETNPGPVRAAFSGDVLTHWDVNDRRCAHFLRDNFSAFKILQDLYNVDHQDFNAKEFYHLGCTLKDYKAFPKGYLLFLINKKVPESDILIQELVCEEFLSSEEEKLVEEEEEVPAAQTKSRK